MALKIKWWMWPPDIVNDVELLPLFVSITAQFFVVTDLPKRPSRMPDKVVANVYYTAYGIMCPPFQTTVPTV
jgi:hypothetical protein